MSEEKPAPTSMADIEQSKNYKEIGEKNDIKND